MESRSFLEKPFAFASLIMSVFSIQALVGGIGYLIFELNWAVIIAMVLAPLGLFFFKKYWPREKPESASIPRFIKRITPFGFVLEIALLANLYLAQTTNSSPSPWQYLDLTFFWLFFTATLFVLVLNFLVPSKTTLRLTSLHLLVMYSVTNLIYPLGFGFDGFIHRATEEWIKIHGFIIPKLPIYLGQYAWVAAASKITGLAVKTIDIWLVPLLAAFTLPRFIPITLTKVFKIPEHQSINLTFVLTIIYFFSLHLTTPHNVLILLTILGIFTALRYWNEPTRPLMALLSLMAAAGLFIHPLLGAPLSVFVFALWLNKKFPNQTWVLPTYTIGMSVLVPGLFMSFLYFTRSTIPNFVNPLAKINLFWQYFQTPYWYQHPAAWYWDALYIWEWLIPLVIILFAVLGYFYFKNARAKIFILTALALTISSFLLRTLVVFPDVHANEQGDYPLRLLKSALLFILPLAMAGIWRVNNWCANLASKYKNLKLQYVLSLIGLAGLVTISWYLSYPQWNPKVQFPGYNVSAADYEAIAWIHNQNQDYNYVVLANQITAIAALEKYSFAKYFLTPEGYLSYYSIPTGGTLYNYFTEMWNKGQNRETMIKAMDAVGVNKAYFVIPAYWTKFDSIVAGAKKSADSWQAFDNQKIYVFTYERK